MLHPVPHRTTLALSSLLVAAVACGDSASSTGTGGSGAGQGGSTSSGSAGVELPCDVNDVLVSNCQICHAATPKFGAPMPLTTRAELLAFADQVKARINDSASPMPPPPGELDAAEKSTLEGYLDAGLPKSDDTCSGAGGSGGGTDPVSCTPDLILKPAAAYEMPSDKLDQYVCVGVELTAEQKKHITAISPLIDNETILHHILLLQADTPYSTTAQPCDALPMGMKLVYAWGPGTGALELPPEAGYPVGGDEPGHFVIQYHYNNVAMASGEKDQSGMQLCTTDTLRPFDADIMAFGSVGFEAIPPGQTKTLECKQSILGLLDPYMPVQVFRSWPHMHQIGRKLSSYHTRDGVDTMMVDVPNYDFNYQIGYETNVELDVSDVVTTRCTWENTSNENVGFGEGSFDEMCFNFVSYYPRITLPQWQWLLPSANPDCTWTQ